MLAYSPVGHAAHEPTHQPNIVVIMADDLDSGSLYAALSEGYMPNLQDSIVDTGTEFTESFVTFPLCCPSRATYLTGLYAHNHDILWNTPPAGGFESFDDSSTIATWMQSGGYRTAHVGKYLNGYEDAAYVPPGWDEWYSLVDNSTYCMYNYTISNNGVPENYGDQESDYQTDVLAGYVEQFIANSELSNDEQPMFLTVMPLAPHLETTCNFTGIRPAPRHDGTVNLPLPMPPSLNEEDMSDKPVWMRSQAPRNTAYLGNLYNDRIASLRAVDDLIGRLIVALENAGELPNTVLIFTSDNGYFVGEHRQLSKILLYEEAIRVPLFVNFPQQSAPAEINKIALNNDLAPTIAELAGVAPPNEVDGRSLLPLFESTEVPWRNQFLIEHPPAESEPFRRFPAYFAVRETNPANQESWIYGETVDRDGNLTDRELYNLTLDPYQLDSLHRVFSWQVFSQWAKLSGYMETLKTCADGTCQTIEDSSEN